MFYTDLIIVPLCVLLTAVSVVKASGPPGQTCEGTRCNRPVLNYYKTQNCTALYNQGSCCPSSFQCADNDLSENKCAFNGKLYEHGGNLDGTEVGLPCENCICSVYDGRASWSCAVFDCFHWPPVPKKCRRVFLAGDCCPSGIHCDSTAIAAGAHTCSVGNVTYLEGHTFHPPGEPCTRCVCQIGFNGTFAEPWCLKTPCSFQLYAKADRQACAPVFHEKRACCPVGWHCPTGEDSVLPSSVKTFTGEQCMFGELRFNVSERLAMGNVKCLECSCLIPPHLTCTKKAGCQECNPAYCITPNLEYYREMSCRPVHDNDSCCPTRFDCSAVLNKKNKCHFDGELFKHKDELVGTDVGLPCEHCTCHVEDGVGSWSCAIPECFNWPLVSENCRHIVVQDSCCPTGVSCGNTTGNTTETEDEFYCTIDGITYAEGHVFESQESPCKKCVCLRGFNGTLSSPWCEDLVCGFQLHHWPKIINGCVPVYAEKDSCCPVDWHCPLASDTVVEATWFTGHSSPNIQCSFGHLELDLHDSLAPRDDDDCATSCTCYTPPTLSCKQQRHC